jgi:NIPSNAP protein
VKRRTFVHALPAATLLPASLWAAAQQGNANPAQASTAVYELRVYHAAPGKLADLLARFRDHTIKIFDRHGIKSVAYWTPLDEPEKSNTLIYILQHPSREAAAANWKSFQDDPEWKSVHEKSEVNGKLVEKVDSTFLTLTDFSPRLGSRRTSTAPITAECKEKPPQRWAAHV